MQFQKRYSRRMLRANFVCLFAVLCVTPFPGRADEVAKLYSVEGTVEWRPSGGSAWDGAQAGKVFATGDSLRIGEASRAALVGSDGLMVRLKANAFVNFKGAVGAGNGEVNIANGDAHVMGRDAHKITNVTTSIVSGSIRGTEFAVSVGEKEVRFAMIDGTVELSNQYGSATLRSGEEGVTVPGKAPVKRIMVRPFDAVQWTFRYPALVSLAGFSQWFAQGTPAEKAAFDSLSGPGGSGSQGFTGASSRARLGRAMAAYRDRGTAAALAELPAKSSDAASMLFLAALALESGDVERAGALHSELRAHHGLSQPGNGGLRGLLLSQETIVAIVQNRRDDAARALGQAGDEQGVELRYAASLDRQSRGDIEGALERARAALELEKDNPRLLARVAELEFGRGYTAEAEVLVSDALRFDPEDYDARTVSGFILLSRGKITEALGEFQRAVDGGGSGAAYLGLGIAQIRAAQLEQGRLSIQRAVHLEPNVSLYRSYLGKAFFEQNRAGQAGQEYGIAKKLDDLDPTPYLYDAFNELALFSPVKALFNLEDSIARNENRAVFRSRMLLDQDQATRGTGLGRIFSALDFIEPARIEALKALAEDPANYSARFLLNDSLLASDTESAAIAEEVTGTLLAPATFSSLLPTASGGATLNEYTTLFERDQFRTGVDLNMQSHEEVVDASAVHFGGGQDYSYLMRYAHSHGNGYRDGDTTRLHTGRLLGQKEFTADDKLLLEGIISASETGDTSIGLDPDFSDGDFETDLDDLTIRAGYRHSWDVRSHLLAQALFVNSRFKIEDGESFRPFGVTFEGFGPDDGRIEDSALFDALSRVRTKGVRGDLQHIWNSDILSLVTGASAVGFREEQDEIGFAEADDRGLFEDFSIESKADNDVRAYRGYSYATWKPVREARIVTGLNYSHIERSETESEPFIEGERSDSAVSPKAGLLLYPDASLTIRAAYFETLAASTARELEGIEQSQVAGIRQLFDDPAGTDAQTFGVGLDWKLPKQSYAGVEFLDRKLRRSQTFGMDEVLISASAGGSTSVTPSDENEYSRETGVGGYLNQVIGERLVGSLKYNWVEQDPNSSEDEIRTHKLRTGFNYFAKSGFFAFGSATWRIQDRDGLDSPDEDDSADFWILSGGVGMQLPDRHGSVQLAVRNILDQDFRYEPISDDVRFYPGVDVALSFNVNF